MKKINIELSLNPGSAALIAMVLSAYSNNTQIEFITDKGKAEVSSIAQKILDQVAEKTDWEALESLNKQS